MGNRVEVNVKMDDRHTIKFEIDDKDVMEIYRKYALIQQVRVLENNILDFLNYRQN